MLSSSREIFFSFFLVLIWTYLSHTPAEANHSQQTLLVKSCLGEVLSTLANLHLKVSLFCVWHKQTLLIQPAENSQTYHSSWPDSHKQRLRLNVWGQHVTLFSEKLVISALSINLHVNGVITQSRCWGSASPRAWNLQGIHINTWLQWAHIIISISFYSISIRTP